MTDLTLRPVKLISILTLLVGVAPLDAHTNPYPRWDQVDLSPTRIEVKVGWDLDPGQASREVRQRYDLDHDGFLSDPERDALRAWMGEAAARWLQIAADGKILPLHRDKIEVRPLDVPVDSNRPLGVIVDLSAPLPLSLTSLTLTDQHPGRTFPVMLSLVDKTTRTLTTCLRARGSLLDPPPPTAVSAGQWNQATRQLTHVALEPGEVLWMQWSGGDPPAIKLQPR